MVEPTAPKIKTESIDNPIPQTNSSLMRLFKNKFTWENVYVLGRDLSLGAWLLLLYFFCTSMVVYSLSAHQLNYQMLTAQTVDGIDPGSIRQNFSKWIDARSDVDREKSRLEVVSKSIDAAVSEKFSLHGFVEGEEDIARENASIAYLDTKLDELRALENDITAEYREKEGYFDLIQQEIAQSLNQGQDTANDKVIPNEVISFFSTLAYFESEAGTSFGEGWFAKILPNMRSILDLSVLTKMPADMLTLILVIFMGALGGTIHLTQIYFREKDKSHSHEGYIGAWYYLFRPALGCVTAVAVYILAKAGILIVAAPNTSGSSGALSPYFVSFLGIISGLVSETALRTIKDTGLKWFSNANTVGRDRWAFGLSEKLEKMGAKLEEENPQKYTQGAGRKYLEERISGVLEVREATVRMWANEEIAVPHKYQTTLAAFVHATVREIFSDLARGQLTVDEPNQS